ncbi:MAG: hypothetical protein K0Q95_3072 [Bacteroidota bacterium]|jgi:quercetin dioxygenase-like cupin family protein|nr:hypothetical protein [Bacteroidota bacterium]
MIIKEIISQMENATQPVVKVLHKGDSFKVLVIGFKNGTVLKDHKTNKQTKLSVLSGEVIYTEGQKRVILEQYDDLDIPIDVMHAVEATEDSLCLLTQG